MTTPAHSATVSGNQNAGHTPKPVTDLDLAFGGRINELLPPYLDIPEDFKRDRSPWNHWQREWFFNGLKEIPKPLPGIDGDAAMRHLAAIQGSFAPKHEHKAAGVAYLASLWFQPIAKATS